MRYFIEQEKYGWEFIFLKVQINAKEASKIKRDSLHSIRFYEDDKGISESFETINNYVLHSRQSVFNTNWSQGYVRRKNNAYVYLT